VSGTPIYARGNMAFQLPGMTINVAPECSGLHSSLALFITSLLAGFIFLRSTWTRTILCLAVIPLGIIRNAFRIFAIGELCVHIGPQMIDSYIHRTGGWMFFLVSLGPFFLILFLFLRGRSARERAQGPIQAGYNMSQRFRFPLILAATGLLALVCTSCSPQAKKARAMERANRYFVAGQYDAAEIEYLNVLRIDKMDPQALGRLGVIYFDQGRVGKSLPFLLIGRQLEPENLEVRLELGLYLLAFGRFQEARDEADYILNHDPSYADAPLLLAETAVRPKEIEEARQRLGRLPAPVTNGAPVLVALGTLDFRQRHFPEAEALFKRALAVDPKYSAAYTALGALYWEKNDMADAEQAFTKAADLSSARSAKRLQYAQFKIKTGNQDAGRQILLDIVQKTPDFLPASMLLAELDEREKRYDESAASVAKVLARDPAYPDALLLSGRLWLAKGNPEKAAAVLENARKIYPKYPQIEYELAQAYLAEGATEKAANNLNLAVAGAPDFAEAVVALAEIDIRKGDAGAAVGLLTRVIQKHPDLTQPRFLLAQAYVGQNDLDNALAVYRQIAEGLPQSPQPRLLAGMVLLRQNRREEARSEFEKALALAPDYFQAMEQLVNLDLGEKQYPAARQRVEAQIAKKPESAELYFLLGRIYLAQRDIVQGEAALKKAIQLKTDAPSVYFLLAELYVTTKQDSKALADLREVLTRDPKDTQALMLMGTIEDREKDYAASKASYERLLAADPSNGPALNNLAYVYSEKFGDLDKAFEMAQKARKVLPNEPHVADTLGWILFKRHQYRWALSLLAEGVNELQTDPEIQYHLGMTQYMLGDEASARISLERALQPNQDFPGIDQARQCLSVLAIDVRTAGPGERSALEKAAADRPDDPVVLSRLAGVYEREGSMDKAIGVCETALRADPKDLAAITLLAHLYSSKGDTAKAFDLAKAAHNLAPEDPKVAHILGQLAYRMHDYPWSLSLLKEASAQLPNDPDVLFDLAQAFYSLGGIRDAEAAMRSALDSNAHFDRAEEATRFLELLALEDDPARALSQADRIAQVLKVEPGNAPALMANGAVFEQKNNPAAATQEFEKVLDHYPDFSPAEKHLMVLYAENPGNDRKAFELATKAREAFPNDAQVARACGIVVYRHGDFRRAANLLEEAANQLPGDSESAFFLGMARYRLKDKAWKATLERALGLDLRADLAAEARRTLAEGK
jgi:exosortase/archaeosortase family protein